MIVLRYREPPYIRKRRLDVTGNGEGGGRLSPCRGSALHWCQCSSPSAQGRPRSCQCRRRRWSPPPLRCSSSAPLRCQWRAEEWQCALRGLQRPSCPGSVRGVSRRGRPWIIREAVGETCSRGLSPTCAPRAPEAAPGCLHMDVPHRRGQRLLRACAKRALAL